MTLDEAIKHCEEVADSHDSIKQIKAVTLEECRCADEHRQLAEWLKELKVYKEQGGDAISRQAVLEGLRTCYDTETKEYSDGSQWINYEDAVAEMENLPSVKPQPCEDCISRAYIGPIIEELENICVNGDEHVLDLLADIKNAPSATPQQKMGNWIESKGYDDIDHFYVCSECGRYINLNHGSKLSDYPYCHCGAKMEEVKG